MRTLAAGAAMLAAGAPLGAVGLGPLVEDGVIDGPRRGFSLTLMNPYRQATDFRVYAVGAEDELPQLRVTIMPASARLGAGMSRRLLVVANDLAPGEYYAFRVCAERAELPEGMRINARVCSKLSARRIL